MPKIDLESIPLANTTGYPAPYDADVKGRWFRRLGPITGLTDLRASHVVLKPGAWSSQRHWHMDEDELLIMISGEAVLIEDNGRTALNPGDICSWPMGNANGHHIVNESDSDCCFVAISAGNKDGSGAYSDIDMKFDSGAYYHKDGTPYPVKSI